MTPERFLTLDELEAGLEIIRQSPRAAGTLEMIVRRPNVDEREIVDRAELDLARGMVGDNWLARGSSRTPDGTAHPEMQLTLMNSRAADLIAQDRTRWIWAGDQLYVDFDLSAENVPPGTRLSIGSGPQAVIVEVTPVPHTGCQKFAARFGVDAMKFVNSPAGKALQLRGINTKVIQGGTIRVGDAVRQVETR